MPNENIIWENSYSEKDCALYLLIDGEVEVYKFGDKMQKTIATIDKNSWFGEFAFFADKANIFSYKSTTYTTLY